MNADIRMTMKENLEDGEKRWTYFWEKFSKCLCPALKPSTTAIPQ